MRRTILLFAMSLIAAATACHGTHPPVHSTDASLAKRASSVLIVQYMFNPGSAALLIKDPAAIKELAELVAENPRGAQHACGYQWLIAFRDQAGQVAGYPHNEDCEEYQNQNRRVHRVLRAYFERIRRSPSHFVYNVRVPASAAPDDVVTRLGSESETVFFLDGVNDRLPRIHIETSTTSPTPADREGADRATEVNLQAATKKLADAIAVIRKSNPAIQSSVIENRETRYGDKDVEHSVESTIYFPYGATIPDHVVTGDVHILETVPQPTHYTIQMVSTGRSAAAIKQIVEQKLGTPVWIAAYPGEPAQVERR